MSNSRDKKPTRPAAKEAPIVEKTAEKPAEKRSAAEALLPWAAACLEHADGGRAPEPMRATGAMQAIGRAFGLSEGEVALVLLAWAVERDFGLARKARALGGGVGLTVELARAALGADVDGMMAPERPLTRFALLVTDGEGATARLRLGRGLGARLDGRAPRGALGGGVHRLGQGELGAATPQPVDPRLPPMAAEWAVQEDAARLYAVGGCGRREALQLALLLGQRLGRGVTFVDGEALGRGSVETLAAARREADLDGDVVLVAHAVHLGEAWRAAATPASPTAARPPFVVVTDGAEARDLFLAPGMRLYTASLGAPPVAAAVVAGQTPSANAPPAKPQDDGLDHIRQMAVRDAERALGIVRPSPPPRPTVPGTVTAPGLQQATAPAVAPAPSPAPTATTPAAPSPVAATPAAPDAPKRKRSKKAMELLGLKDDDEPRPSPVAAPVVAPVAPPPPVAAPAASAPQLDAAEMAQAEALPWVVVPPDAPLGALARIAMTSPNPLQRAEILTALHRVRDPAVVAAMRANAQSPHVAVRQAAETGMQILFGASWNAARPVPKPVQPPPSDDKDRGPPGGW